MVVMAMFAVAIVAGQTRGGDFDPAAQSAQSVSFSIHSSADQFDHAEMLFPVIETVFESPLRIKPLHLTLDFDAGRISLRRNEPGAIRD